MRRDENRSGHPVRDEDVLMQIAAIAYRKKMDLEIEEIAKDTSASGVSPEMTERIHSSVINDFSQFRKRKARKRRRRRILHITACLLVLCIALPFGIYHVDAARVATVNFIIQNFPKYSEIHYDVQSNALPPIGWNLPYYPTWLPEGTKVTQIGVAYQSDIIWYEDAGGYGFYFAVASNSAQRAAYDDEDAVSQEITINGYTAIFSYSPKKNISTLIIPIEDCILVLRGSLSETDICKIGEKINSI